MTPVDHITCDDVTEQRRPTPAEREVLDLLDLAAPGRPWVRLSLAQWRHVDRVAAALTQARAPAAATGVPAPRASTDPFTTTRGTRP